MMNSFELTFPMDSLKKLSLFILIIGFFSLLLFWFLNHKFSPAYLKQLLTQQISRVSQKTAVIHGEVKWQLFPTPKVAAKDIEIGQENRNDDYSLKIKEAKFSLKLSSLLMAKIHFNKVEFKTVAAKIHYFPEAGRKPKTKGQTATVKKSSAPALIIHEFILSNSSIELNDPHGKIMLQNVNLKMNDLSFHSTAFPVHLTAKIKSDIPQSPFETDFKFNGHLKWSKEAIQNKDLSAIELKGTLESNQMKLGTLKIDSLDSNISVLQGQLKCAPLQINMYSSASKGDLNIDLQQKNVRISQNASGLNAEKFFSDTAGIKFIQGKLDYQFAAIFPLSAFDVNKIKAKGQLSLREGEFKGFDVEQLMNEVSSMLMPFKIDKTNLVEKGLQLASFNIAKLNQGKTAFNLTSMEWQLIDGKLRTDNIILTSDRLDIKGQGQVDFIDQQINSQFQAAIKNLNQNSKVYIVQEILGGAFPASLSGPIHHPRLTPDLKVLNPLIEKLFLEKTMNQSVQSIKHHLKSMFR